MAIKRFTHSKNIVVGDIIRRHPNGMRFETDMAYTELANKIYDVINAKLPGDFDKYEAREISADIAIYCEDVISGTHLFETFSRLYRRMFNYSLPFFDDATDERHGKFSLNAMRFVAWHSIMAQNLNRIINPFNIGVKTIAEDVLDLLEIHANDLPSNDDLADYLYSEETQADPIEVKKVLAWLMYDCYLGRWELHDSQEESIRILLNGRGSERMIEYADRSLCAVDSRTWPLSLKPQTIYAEMTRIEMEDDDDDVARAIEDLASAPLGLYHIESCGSDHIVVKDYQGKNYNIAIDSFDYTPKDKISSNHITEAIASFITLDNRSWYVNGICCFTGGTLDDFDAYCRAQSEAQAVKERLAQQFDDIIALHNGERLFFFKDAKAYAKWLKKDLQLSNVDDFDMDMLPSDEHLAVFIEPSGNMTISTNAQSIKHPGNKFYDRLEAREYGLHTIFSIDSCTPTFARYLIENKLLPDAMLNDARGGEYGRRLLQDNIEFFVRCIRRDIDTNEPFSTREGTHDAADKPVNIDGKMPYGTFVDEIMKLNQFMSAMYKKWDLIDASETVTVVLDEKGNEFTIPTRELYEAHLALDSKHLTNKYVEPFLSLKRNAAPAAAILHNVAGKGRTRRALLEAIRNLGLDKMR